MNSVCLRPRILSVRIKGVRGVKIDTKPKSSMYQY